MNSLVGIGITLEVQSPESPGHPTFLASSSSVIFWLLVSVGSTPFLAFWENAAGYGFSGLAEFALSLAAPSASAALASAYSTFCAYSSFKPLFQSAT